MLEFRGQVGFEDVFNRTYCHAAVKATEAAAIKAQMDAARAAKKTSFFAAKKEETEQSKKFLAEDGATKLKTQVQATFSE